MTSQRSELANGIGFTTIIDEKFKTASIAVRFLTPLSRETAAVNAVGMGVLSTASRKYPEPAKLNEKLSALYGAGLTSFARKRGDLQVLGISASWLDNRYAFDGEDVSGEMLAIVRDCLFDPDTADGRFTDEPFQLTKTDLLDRIEAELNNKRGYAIAKAFENAFRGEPAANSCYGDKETASAVTPEAAYQAYRNVLETAQVEITLVAPSEIPGAAESFRQEFEKIDRRPEPVTFRTVSPVKPEPETVTETMDVQQCKMVMCFKTGTDDIFAMRMLSVILGELPVSKLFLNVREKLSLCYYCVCGYSAAKGSFAVDCGVERKNIEKAKAEILRQIDSVIEGDISDEEMESALLSRDDILTSVGDTPASWSSWYFEHFCSGSSSEPAEEFLDYKAVTKARIVHAAESLKLDTVYIMLDKEAE